jgi:hypothetical protein
VPRPALHVPLGLSAVSYGLAQCSSHPVLAHHHLLATTGPNLQIFRRARAEQIAHRRRSDNRRLHTFVVNPSRRRDRWTQLIAIPFPYEATLWCGQGIVHSSIILLRSGVPPDTTMVVNPPTEKPNIPMRA